MIEVKEITKRYGDQVLFEKASFTMLPGERIGLVGRNGHGKSTLLKIMIGKEEPDEGAIAIPNNYRIGYLHQILEFTEPTVLAEAAKGLAEGLEEEVWRVKKTLMGLGFKLEDFEKAPSLFSGGYQMRIELAKVLVSDPDLLLLDEPTNFLDIISIRWLERFLRLWRGELVIISHDRDFMDNIVTHVVGIHRTKIRKIKGTTDKYYSQIAEEEEIYEKRRLNEEKKRKDVEEYIATFRSKATKAKSVQSSIKMLEKMGKTEKLENVKTLSFSFNSVAFRPPVVLDARNITFSYSGTGPYLLNDFNLTVQRGDKICIAGANGKGKTTLAKILAGVLKPVNGEVKTNPQVMMAFYEQGNTAKLDKNLTVEDEIFSSHPTKDRTAVRNICGAMMFPGDNSLKKISVLSGGERSRVLLGKTLMVHSNLLILDEPTHHLDMESCSALFEAVKEYDGAAIAVTHDEYFLHKVATKLVVFRGDKVIVFPGNYSQFLDRMGWEDEPLEKKETAATTKAPEKGINPKEARRLRAELLAKRREKLGPFEAKIKKMEQSIAANEQEYNILNEKLVNNPPEAGDPKEMVESYRRHGILKAAIDKLYHELDAVMSEHERVKKEFEQEGAI